MSVASMFEQFLTNLVITNGATISARYGELTAALNKKFRDTESKTANSLRVGSFGRNTGIDGLSDLDMLYLMPKSEWENYESGKQLKLLQDTKSAILARYPNTAVRVDRLVVTVSYTNFHVEVQPVFEQADRSFKYPDTKNGGSWKITKPREEMSAVSDLDALKNTNLRRLCRMVRAWRNKHGIAMGGLLVDTLAYNFLKQTSDFDNTSFQSCGVLAHDFFEYISQLPEQDRYNAPGSGQHVRVKQSFQRKAKKALRLCNDAIDVEGEKGAYDRWKKVFGRPFPAKPKNALAMDSKIATWNDTEEHIEDRYPVDIQYNLRIDCDVKQKGFREHRLSRMIARKLPLLAKKNLEFEVVANNVPTPYTLAWKVLNRGDEAVRRNNVRGQIVFDAGYAKCSETTNFRGDHVVECYAIKEGVVVAKDRIHVPISENG